MANLVPEGEAFYGIQLPIQTLTRTLADPWEDDATPEDLARVARAAEEAGQQQEGEELNEEQEEEEEAAVVVEEADPVPAPAPPTPPGLFGIH